MQLADLVREDLIFSSLPGVDAATVLRAFADRFAEAGLVPKADELYGKLLEREELGSTGIGSGVAIPHCKLRGLKQVLLAVGTTEQEIDFGAVDGRPVRLFFVLISPESNPAEHLKSLAAISKWVKTNEHLQEILEVPDQLGVFHLLTEPEAPAAF